MWKEISKEKKKEKWHDLLIKDALTKGPLRGFLHFRVDFEDILWEFFNK